MEQLEGRTRFTSLLVREICATWTLEAGLARTNPRDNESKERPKPPMLPPSLILNAIWLVRRATIRCNGEIPCSLLAEACIFIASKITEHRLRLDDICKSGRLVEARRRGKVTSSLTDRRRAVLHIEMRILAMCGFVVKQSDESFPHRYLLVLSEIVLPLETQAQVLQSAWAYLNDAAMLDMESERPLDVACAALALSAQDESTTLPSEPFPWFEAVGANKESMERIAYQIYEFINVWQAPTWMDT